MRIAILTQPLRYNYGGILQNYALQTVLRRMGHDVVTLDPHRYHYKWWQYPILILRHTITRYIRGYREVPIFAEWFRDKEIRVLGTNTFRFINQNICRKEYWDLTKDIKEQDYDAFIVGSDQVWRPEYNRNLTNMFLDFTKDWTVRRIAYAASFGTDTWSADEDTTRKCCEGIRNFDMVTVREESGINLCHHLFNVLAQQVLDPTLLLDADDYRKLFQQYDTFPYELPGKLYTYILDETSENQQLISNYANQTGMRFYTYNSKISDWKHPHTLEEQIQPPVELWLKGFEQASYIITDSFHACVFSIIFKKQFAVYGNPERGMSRYKSFFKLLGLQERFVRNYFDIKALPIIDYNKVNAEIRKLRTQSLNLLTAFLS